MSYLLDTDICSAYIKGDRQVWPKVIQFYGRLHVSAITVAELFAWTLRRKASPARHQALLDFLSDVAFLEVSEDVSRKYGEIRASELDHGQFTPEMDLLIAATALVHGLIVVTHNTPDFAKVQGLSVEDWLAP